MQLCNDLNQYGEPALCSVRIESFRKCIAS